MEVIMVRNIIFGLIFLTPVSYAQDVMTTDQQAVTVTRTSVPAAATPVAPVVTTPAVTTDIAVTPAFPGAVTPTVVPVATPDILTTNPQTAFCPPLSYYYIPDGYRIAGMSPTCQVVIVPMEPTS
jgi:hypothetical protein